jgi:hypothetical protein
MARKFTLASLLLRPIRAYREAYKIFKNVELRPVVSVQAHVIETNATNEDYFLVNGVAFPAETWKLIRPSLVKVDSKYMGLGKAQYNIADEQRITVSVITKDEMTALRVAKRFEEAS